MDEHDRAAEILAERKTTSSTLRPGTTLGDRLAYSVGEAAELIGCSRAWLYPFVLNGSLPSALVGRRRLIPRVALERWLASQTSAVADTAGDDANSAPLEAIR